MDFKKAFDRVWHAGLWQVLRSFNIEKGLVQAIQALYENSSSAVLLNRQLAELFETTVGVQQECLLLFSLFLEKMVPATLHDYHTSISIGGRPTCNLRLADNVDLIVWVAAVNSKTSSTDLLTEQRHMKPAQKRVSS